MTPVKTLTANGVTYTCPFAEAMPPLTPDERADLAADIRANGITVPVVVTDENEVIDGHNRLEIAAEIEIADVPVRVLTGLTPAQKRERADDLNLHRRHLTRGQRRAMVADRLRTDPGRSDRAIADAANVDHKTVGKVRTALVATGEIPQLAETRGRDDRSRPTARRREQVADRQPPEVGAEETATATDAGGRKPPKPLSWWPSLVHEGERVHNLGQELKKLSKTRVAERSPGPVSDVARRLRQVADQLDRQAAEGGDDAPR